MILNALVDYYLRLAIGSDDDIPPYGFEDKEIGFLIVINETGEFINIRDVRVGEGKKRTTREFRVPLGEKKTSGIKENLLWDNPQYVLGAAKTSKAKDVEKADKAFSAFKKRLQKDLAGVEDAGVFALLSFYENENISSVRTHPLFAEVIAENSNITFILEGDTFLIAQRPKVVERITELYETIRSEKQPSAISGEHDEIAILHTAIKGVWGAKTSGANIVSFNDPAYCSHGRTKDDQGLNAPIGKHNQFAYTTALNRLLKKGSRQRMQVGDASTVFWAKDANPIEDEFSWLIGEPPKGEEAASYGKIRSLLGAVKSGVLPPEDDLPFYVLGLAPNASRIAIRFWYEGSVKEVKKKIAQHFEDIDIVRAPHDREFLSLFQLLLSTATEGKADNIPSNLSGDVARAVLSGAPYPRTLLVNAIRRCKADRRIPHARAALIKGILVRNARFTKTTNREVSVALDREYDNIGYVLGRLFAVLERIQEQAQGMNLNKTIRDTYFGAACSNPLVTFKRLQDLAIHHLAKIRNSGKNTVWLEKLMQEVVDLIPATGIPSILKIDDQGRFAVGYYHQRQDFFTKKETEEQGEKA